MHYNSYHTKFLCKNVLLRQLSFFRNSIGETVSNEEVYSFQNRVYSFLQLVKPHQPDKGMLLAMDISFDGMGCTYILEWALESVSSFITLYAGKFCVVKIFHKNVLANNPCGQEERCGIAALL